MKLARSARSLVLSLALAGCASEAPRSDGKPPERVISLIPSATETLIALGAGDHLVARTDYDTMSSLARLPSLGEGLTPSLELISTLEPDLVIAWPDNMSRNVSDRLNSLGIELYTPQAQSLADIYRTTVEIGRLLGLEARADSLNTSIRTALADVGASVAGRERPSVFYVVWHDPPTTVGPGTYIHELIEIAGGRNIFADAPALWPQVSMEEIVRRDPDMIILPRGEGVSLTVEGMRKTVGWRELTAVRIGSVAEVDAFLLNRPGPGVASAARRLRALLHPALAVGRRR